MGRLSFKMPWLSTPSSGTSHSSAEREPLAAQLDPQNSQMTAQTLVDHSGPRFYVELEDPHRIYSPGATVAGKIVLLVAKAQKVSSVKVDVHGFVQIKNMLLSARSITRDLCRLTIDLWTAEDSSTAGSATASTISGSTSSTSDSSNIFLPAGEHRFPFEFSLPKTGLMSSLTFERGNISYLVTGILCRPGRTVQHSSPQPLSITVPLDVAHLPPAKVTRIAIDVTQRRRSSPSGSASKVIVQLELPSKGYIRGEEIPLRLAIKHQWAVQNPAGIIVTLVRITKLEGADIDSQTFRKDLDQVVLPLYTDPKTLAANVVGNLRVPPDAFPTMRHRDLVTFQYMLEVTMDVTGKRDLQKYVARDPAFTLIDTVELKQKSGIVSAWTEVIIGTSRTTLGGSDVAISRIRQSIGPLSERSMHVELSSLSSSAAPSPVTTPPNAQQTAAEEKAELAAREAVLLPSAPPVALQAHQVSAPGLGMQPGPSNSQPGPSDKREAEQARLQNLASAPEDFVPRYEPPAPEFSVSGYPEPSVAGSPTPLASAPQVSAPHAPSAPPAQPDLSISAPPAPSDLSISAPPAPSAPSSSALESASESTEAEPKTEAKTEAEAKTHAETEAEL